MSVHVATSSIRASRERGAGHATADKPLLKLLFSGLLAIVIPIGVTEAVEGAIGITEPWEWLLHSVVLFTSLTPAFYFLWYRPLRSEVLERTVAEAEVRRLSRQIMDAAEEERRRLARDLHDDFGQKLVALQLQLDLHRKNFAGSHPELMEQSLQINHAIASLADDLRHVIGALRPPLLDDFGLVPALEAQLTDLRRLCPTLEMRLIVSGMSLRLPLEVESTLFRVCQEALNNVIRHARAQYVEIRLTGSYPSIILIIEDDGVGFQMTNPTEASQEEPHYGLLGIRERVAAIGGWVKVQSAPGKGTRLRIEVPFADGR